MRPRGHRGPGRGRHGSMSEGTGASSVGVHRYRPPSWQAWERTRERVSLQVRQILSLGVQVRIL